MGIDLVSFACPLVGSALFERLMQALDHLGHGLVAVGTGVAITAWGLAKRDRRLMRTGLAIVLASALAGLLANLLKLVVQLPRPGGRIGSYGFPSGHTTTAFAVAAVLGRAFPAAGPLFYLMALFSGLARVYYRDHFLIDVVGGGLLGAASGLAVAKRLAGPSAGTRSPLVTRAWGAAGVAAIVPVAWLAVYEHQLDTHLLRGQLAPERHEASVVIPFGTDYARGLLRKGWSGDERWEGTLPFVWAEGLESTLSIPALPPVDHRARLRMIPFVRGQGLSCQVVEVALNGGPVGRLVLDRGWNRYELRIPRRLIRSGSNEMKFRFAYAGRVASGQDPRRLSVAFGSLEILADSTARPGR